MSTLPSPYPQSRASTTSETGAQRTKGWSASITQDWVMPASGIETFQDRVERYLVYFRLTRAQVEFITTKFVDEMNESLEQQATLGKSENEMLMSPTAFTASMLPTGNEVNSAYSLEFGGAEASTLHCARISLKGNGKLVCDEQAVNLRDENSGCPNGLLGSAATATQLFDTMADSLHKLISRIDPGSLKTENSKPVPLGFAFCFPTIQNSIREAVLQKWVKGYQTGRATIDPVEGVDVVLLLEHATKRKGLPVRVEALLNDTTAALITCAYERGANAFPPCRAAFILGSGVNGCVLANGRVINTECGGFDKHLPVNDIDLEIDFAEPQTQGLHLFEKMVATTYLGELCRRLVVKVWQHEAPTLAWSRQSLPWLACVRIISDKSEDMGITKLILDGVWKWDPTVEECRVVQTLFEAVFERSAALTAVALIGLAKQTGCLQEAMGGLACAIQSSLYSMCNIFREHVHHYMEVIAGTKNAKQMILVEVQRAGLKGAGIYAATLKK